MSFSITLSYYSLSDWPTFLNPYIIFFLVTPSQTIKMFPLDFILVSSFISSSLYVFTVVF
ncbi:hypothetical protein J3Q64DRAFT_1725261 [Phycomyces blakesleeanus]|uniref:Uncharacterized protein n=1 Tax=Phycomyces blakesleeanus TaxID=4837 RepID=A0ABR3B7C9_PHYBL